MHLKSALMLFLTLSFLLFSGTTFSQATTQKEAKKIEKKAVEKIVITSKPYYDSENVPVMTVEQKVNLEVDPNHIYTVPEIPAVYPGGSQAFTKFIFSKYKSPTEEQINAKAFASFVIEKDGTLSDIKVLRDPGFGIGTEIIKIIKTSPKWKPAVNNGKVVRSKYTFPISFLTN